MMHLPMTTFLTTDVHGTPVHAGTNGQKSTRFRTQKNRKTPKRRKSRTLVSLGPRGRWFETSHSDQKGGFYRKKPQRGDLCGFVVTIYGGKKESTQRGNLRIFMAKHL